MDNPKADSAIDTRTLEALLGELEDMHKRLATELARLANIPRLSDSYHDRLAEIYTLLTLMQGLASDLKAEMDKLDDQLADD